MKKIQIKMVRLGKGNRLLVILFFLIASWTCSVIEKNDFENSKVIYINDSVLQMELPNEFSDTIFYIPHELCCMEEWKIKFMDDSTNQNYILIRFDPTKEIPKHARDKGLFPNFDRSDNLSIIKVRTPDDFPNYKFTSSDSGKNENTQFIIANFINVQFDTTWITHYVTFDKRKARKYHVYFFYDDSEFGSKFKSKLSKIIAHIKIKD